MYSTSIRNSIDTRLVRLLIKCLNSPTTSAHKKFIQLVLTKADLIKLEFSRRNSHKKGREARYLISQRRYWSGTSQHPTVQSKTANPTLQPQKKQSNIAKHNIANKYCKSKIANPSMKIHHCKSIWVIGSNNGLTVCVSVSNSNFQSAYGLQ